MPKPPDFFRDHGIPGASDAPSPQMVRASFTALQIFGQFAATGMLSGLGILMAVVMTFAFPAPWNFLAALVPVLLFGGLVYFVGRNDYTWIELNGNTLRAKHLYSRRTVERSIDEIDDLLTLVFQVQTLTTAIVESWLGRVRGMKIRFQDGRTPLTVCRSDPAMKNAQELISALVDRMSERAEIDAEVIDWKGEPLVRRICWKTKS